MKKLLAFVFVAALSVSTLFGCASTSATTDKTAPAATTGTETPVTTETPATTETPVVTDSSATTGSTTDTSDVKTPAADVKVK